MSILSNMHFTWLIWVKKIFQPFRIIFICLLICLQLKTPSYATVHLQCLHFIWILRYKYLEIRQCSEPACVMLSLVFWCLWVKTGSSILKILEWNFLTYQMQKLIVELLKVKFFHILNIKSAGILLYTLNTTCHERPDCERSHVFPQLIIKIES